MTFEEPQVILVGKANEVVLGPSEESKADHLVDKNSPAALDLGLDS